MFSVTTISVCSVVIFKRRKAGITSSLELCSFSKEQINEFEPPCCYMAGGEKICQFLDILAALT